MTHAKDQLGQGLSTHTAQPCRRRAQQGLRVVGALTLGVVFAQSGLIAKVGAQTPESEAPSSQMPSGEAAQVFLAPIIIDLENIGRPLFEAPASVSLVTGEEADAGSIFDIRDAVENEPNVTFDTGPSLPTIRGIDGTANATGAFAFTGGSRPRVNIVVDGVARQSNVGGNALTIFPAWDIQQIEVARGPQTTLGGRSSLAGAINILTNDPVYAYEAAARLRAYTTDGHGTYGASVLANVPLIPDQVALRFTADGSIGKTFIDVTDPLVEPQLDDIEDEDNGTIRAKILFTPLSLPQSRTVVTYERSERDGLFQTAVDRFSSDFTLSDFTNSSEDINSQEIFSLFSTFDVNDAVQLEARVSHTASTYEVQPNGIGQSDFEQDIDSVQAEVLARYSGTGVLHRAVMGLAFEEQEEEGVNDTFFALSIDGEIRNAGVFGELEFQLTDRLFLFGGGRYQDEEIERTVAGPLMTISTVDTDDTRFTPKLGARFEANENAVFGYQYSEGHRAGSIDVDIFGTSGMPGLTTVFDGETLKQHEVWTRLRTLDRRLRIDASAFFYTFEDVQVSGAGPGSLIGNLPEAEGFGAELYTEFDVTEALMLTAGLGLVDTEITDAGTDPQTSGLEGSELPNAADYSLQAGFTYQMPSGLGLGVTVRHVSDRTAFKLPNPEAPAYTTVNLFAGYEVETDRFRLHLEAFAKNLFDDEVIAEIDINNVFTPLKVIEQPQIFGATATLRF
ncbi:MAG: TonB-dependent receptor [Pseudomonadota bacterium]